MRPETNELLRRLQEADWFASVGQPLPESVVAVRSWDEAVVCCSSMDWLNFILEMQNRLSMFLHTHARERYGQWNDLVVEVKTALHPLLEGKLAPMRESLGAHEVKNTLEWNILSACMELEYADVREPGFFVSLMPWYIAGRFPCGWGERDASGQVRLHGPVDESEYDPNEPDWLKLVLSNQERVFNPKVRLPAVGKLMVF